MFGIENYSTFVCSILVFQLVPGAGTIAILNATARNGSAAGMAAVAGTLSGDFLYMVASLAGLAAVMQANLVFFQALQWAGAAYLCWLGLRLLCQRGDPATNGSIAKHSPWATYRQAFAVSLTNPKVLLFFVSFFPLFLHPNASMVTLGIMMLHVTGISLVYQALLVVVGHSIAAKLSRFSSVRWLATRLAGAALLGFGVKLAADHRP